MELTGHSGEVFCAKFDPNGNYFASGSMDRTISRSFDYSSFVNSGLTVPSALEDVWQLRELRHFDRP
jgi:WD40 repeat protein